MGLGQQMLPRVIPKRRRRRTFAKPQKDRRRESVKSMKPRICRTAVGADIAYEDVRRTVHTEVYAMRRRMEKGARCRKYQWTISSEGRKEIVPPNIQ